MLQPGDIFYLWLQPHFEKAAGAAKTKRYQAGAWERGKAEMVAGLWDP